MSVRSWTQNFDTSTMYDVKISVSRPTIKYNGESLGNKINADVIRPFKVDAIKWDVYQKVQKSTACASSPEKMPKRDFETVSTIVFMESGHKQNQKKKHRSSRMLSIVAKANERVWVKSTICISFETPKTKKSVTFLSLLARTARRSFPFDASHKPLLLSKLPYVSMHQKLSKQLDIFDETVFFYLGHSLLAS